MTVEDDGPLSQEVQRTSGFVPALDARREEDDLVLAADLPGMDAESDVTVELSGRNLTISGERRSAHEADGLREIRYGTFSRTVSLPSDVDQDSISAGYENGVLTVRVPGVYAEDRPRRIRISTGGSGADGVEPNQEKDHTRIDA
ncbi:Hsp20/alpha crystallin family protein [Nesterenkonia sp. NBAIMH1]|uniref:Hsp20/alpha crystallin family protein n=1 Tax=Nesterenkonia sp. NBAIMH1 TaxID=2600320 RepID=UPI00143D63B5|nr:Hsp20/alpha crystallin family protein [Nesterenkonia sp. NBAIMH1]